MSRLFVVLISIIFVFAKCSKKDAESLLPAATHTGANTMGFLANGEPRSTSGTPDNVFAGGISCKYYVMDSTILLSATTSKSPRFALNLRFKFDDRTGAYPLTLEYPCRAIYFSPSDGSTIPSGDNEFKNDKVHTGQVLVSYWDRNIISGTFNMDLVNEGVVVVHITNGRFDVAK